MTILMMMMKILTSNYWKWKGFVPGVTWGLNLMLGEAPAKGSVRLIEHIYPTPYFFI